MHAKGRIAKYEVTHQYNRRRTHIGDKTRIIIDISEDIGDEMAPLEAGTVEIRINLTKPDQQTL